MSTENKIIAGIDDATKCPCIGSIFIAGVVADEKTIAQWKELGVKDSKLIAPTKRYKLEKIIKESAIRFSIEQITPANMVQEIFNLNDWEMLTVFKIIKKLYRSENLHDIYIDNWEVTKKRFVERFKTLLSIKKRKLLVEHHICLNRKRLRSLNLIAEHRADENYTVVGAASILAKTASDKQYKEYKKIYGDFGSGSPADPATRLFVWQHRHNPLPIIRTTWKTFKHLVTLESIEQDSIYARVKKKLAEKKDSN